jgi:hypothetical protein
MPRPRKLSDGKVVTVYLEKTLYDALREKAKASGLSLSEYIRLVLMQSHPELDPPGQPVSEASVPVASDPVEDVEIKDLENALDELHGRMQFWLERQKLYMSTLRYGGSSGNAPINWSTVKGWYNEWHRLKRWYYGLKVKASRDQRMASIQSKLLTTHDLIEEAKKLVKTK